MRYRDAQRGFAAPLVALIVSLIAFGAHAQSTPLTIALPLSLSGIGTFYGAPALEGAQMALDEENAKSGAPRVATEIEDDKSNVADATTLAHRIIDGNALAVVGPDLTVIATPLSKVYEQGRIAMIVPTAHGDDIPKAATAFQPIFNTGALGAAMADYLHYVLHRSHAAMIYQRDAFGTPIAEGFRTEGEQLGIETRMLPFDTAADRDRIAADVAADSRGPVPAIGSLGGDAVALIKALRRGGLTGPILGPDAISDDAFAALFRNEPEEKDAPGFFTNNVYAASSLLLDSADDAMLSFAARFRARYGHDPSWTATQGYDSMKLAIAAVRHAATRLGSGAPKEKLRAAVVDYLSSLDSVTHAIPGITGPLWFTKERGREQPVRMGRFENGLFESAPLQIMPVFDPDQAEIASGALFEIGSGQYARFQQVVYTGIYLNEVPRLDMAGGAFTADFYLWLRYATADQSYALADPADLNFPDLLRGVFNPREPAVRRQQDDGTVYNLWRIRGDFKDEFDLRHFPLDEQQLSIRLFNARAASDRIVYVLDRQTFDQSGPLPEPAAPASPGGAIASAHAAPANAPEGDTRFALQAAPDAFNQLTQWRTLGVAEFRDNLVTKSGLGDPKLAGLARQRELSGFDMTIDVQRVLLVTLVKSLLPLMLMTLITFAALYFPHGLVKEKITVAITGALSGAVLLTAVNAQLGNVGYTMAVEYVFYVFFGLCLFAILSVLTAERLRVAGRPATAVKTEVVARVVFGATVLLVVAVSVVATIAWRS